MGEGKGEEEEGADSSELAVAVRGLSRTFSMETNGTQRNSL